MNAKSVEAKGFLTRLRRDQRGTTLAMMAAALIPIAVMVGSGLDMSRAYLAKAKLQTACDAAALATRRYMASAALTPAAQAEGQKFFRFNFPDGTMGTAPVTPTITTNATDSSIVEVSAQTTVPTSLMTLVGQSSITIRTACSADQDYVNNDIMLVLDVTGSMNCTAGTNCDYQPTEQSGSRLSRLRTAASALYRALQGATGVRTRYGFLPYSMTVNVGRSLDSTWLRNPATYHTCTTTTSTGCSRWGANTTRGPSTTPAHDSAWFSGTWSGCIEERSDVGGAAWPIRVSSNVSQADIDTVGTTAALQWQPYDDVATTGESNSALGQTYANLVRFCPAAATKLQVYATETAFNNQVTASLAKVGGYTYHELGITWGMRFLSGTGMFASSNPDFLPDASGNPVRVDRHIIFLTDGEMTTDSANYTSYGIQSADDRLSGGAAALQKHKDRFLAACNRARQMGATIWVVALDVGNDADIRPCASGDDHFYVSDGTNLDQIFTLIGKGIGKLRITK